MSVFCGWGWVIVAIVPSIALPESLILLPESFILFLLRRECGDESRRHLVFFSPGNEFLPSHSIPAAPTSSLSPAFGSPEAYEQKLLQEAGQRQRGLNRFFTTLCQHRLDVVRTCEELWELLGFVEQYPELFGTTFPGGGGLGLLRAEAVPSLLAVLDGAGAGGDGAPATGAERAGAPAARTGGGTTSAVPSSSYSTPLTVVSPTDWGG